MKKWFFRQDNPSLLNVQPMEIALVHMEIQEFALACPIQWDKDIVKVSLEILNTMSFNSICRKLHFRI